MKNLLSVTVQYCTVPYLQESKEIIPMETIFLLNFCKGCISPIQVELPNALYDRLLPMFDAAVQH